MLGLPCESRIYRQRCWKVPAETFASWSNIGSNSSEERARIENRLRWHLHELAPGTEPPLRTLGRPKVLRAVDEQLAAHAGMVADIAREQVIRILALSHRIKELEREVAARTAPLAPALLDLPGCASLTAAKIVGEIAGVRRFKSPAAFAMHNGTAPIPVWSGRTDRYRLNRGGSL